MSAVAGTKFYVQKPGDEYWNVGMINYVIEAGPIDVSERGLYDWQKTDEFVRDHLKVVTPKSFAWPHVEKRAWIECSGPSRLLNQKEYVKLYHALVPAHPLPEGPTGRQLEENRNNSHL
ncbi:MAG TPA: hypothetical protein VLF94_02490 [Chlamydiales bacterium]|nr:hypothetical protein [Chlamydiales bacterium]